MRTTKKIFILILFVLIAQLAWGIGAFFTMPSIPTWYAELAKPTWNPPAYLFGPVWITLYILMGIAAFLVWENRSRMYAKVGLIFYVIQLVLNSLWSILFFGLRSPGLAFIEIVVLLLMIITTTMYFARVSRLACILMIPYIAWVSFALVLNLTIWQLN